MKYRHWYVNVYLPIKLTDFPALTFQHFNHCLHLLTQWLFQKFATIAGPKLRAGFKLPPDNGIWGK